MTMAIDVRNDACFLSQTLLADSQVVDHLLSQGFLGREVSVCSSLYSLNVSIHKTDVCKAVPVSLNTYEISHL